MRRRPKRDLDYRGTKPPADFSRFVYEVRRGKPGSLTVLQDVIEEYFPRTYAQLKERARQRIKETNQPAVKELVILFDARTARQRFLPVQNPRSYREAWPLIMRETRELVRGGYLPANQAIVWSSRTGNRISEKLRKLTRRRRAPFMEITPKGIRWYGRVVERRQ